jgi:serine protease Do
MSHMKRFLLPFCILSLSMSAFAAPRLSGYADLVEQVQGSIVSISSEAEARPRSERNTNPFEFFFSPDQRRSPRQQPQMGSGSGFIVSSDGYIVTNRHVVENADKLTVELFDGTEIEAELIGIDDSLDIALLKIDRTGLTSISLGDSDKMRIGDTVLAFGHPLNLGFSVTSGIVSGIGRDMRMDGLDVGTYIQTDADITFGNSGGPLVNANGQVIGINTLIISRGETFGFAIPSNLFERSVDQLKKYKKVRRGALGVSLTDLNDEARDYYRLEKGALITSVGQNMPAQDAGLKPGDVIIRLDGKDVESTRDVVTRIATKAPGDAIKIDIVNDRNARETKTVILGDRSRLTSDGRWREVEPETEDKPLHETHLGFSLRELTPGEKERFQMRHQAGLYVDQVEPLGPAASRGLRSGQILASLNGKLLTDLSDAEQAISALEDNAAIRLVVYNIENENGNIRKQEQVLFMRNTPEDVR